MTHVVTYKYNPNAREFVTNIVYDKPSHMYNICTYLNGAPHCYAFASNEDFSEDLIFMYLVTEGFPNSLAYCNITKHLIEFKETVRNSDPTAPNLKKFVTEYIDMKIKMADLAVSGQPRREPTNHNNSNPEAKEYNIYTPIVNELEQIMAKVDYLRVQIRDNRNSPYLSDHAGEVLCNLDKLVEKIKAKR